MRARRDAPVVVVGGGVAGLSVALAAAPRPVLLVARVAGGPDSASALAQGGIAAALAPGDSAEAHALDTFRAGAWHNDARAVRALVERAPAAIARLRSMGVPFDHDGAHLRLGREAGHRADRIVHAGGDASGVALLATLWHAVRAAGHVEVRTGVQAEALLLRDDAVAGIRLHDASTGGVEVLETGSVVLATGGIGALFAATTNPAGADGNGLALGLAAGAAAHDLEFVQFHPTAMAFDGPDGTLPLATEALRGAGARLLDARGRPLMAGLHPLGDLAPRDVVAREVWSAVRRDGHAWLDATGIGDAWPLRFPTVHALCQAHGLDPATRPIPVTPAAHFHMGGLATGLDGRTGVAGLHAVGEVACTGVHGANRLASNSLLEGVVQGQRIGHGLARGGPVRPRRRGASCWVERGADAAPDALDRLRAALWASMGPARDAAGLQRTRDMLRRDADASGWQGALAERLLDAALRRPGSLGAHHRTDAPGLSPQPTVPPSGTRAAIPGNPSQ